jgi:benzodiazapine receptor
MKNILALIGWIALCFAAAAIGAVASSNAPEFYRELTLPTWAPPASVFGPVWTVLYLLMAIAAWLVWRERGFAGAKIELGIFLAQLAVNALWSWLFFAWNSGLWSFVDITLLWVLITATIVLFWRAKPLAGLLLLPYFAWVSFAAVLNYTIWKANPTLLG